MVEGAGLLGWVGVALLVAALVAWLQLGKGPLLRRLSGKTEVDPVRAEQASRLLALAAGASAIAAIVAVLGLMFG